MVSIVRLRQLIMAVELSTTERQFTDRLLAVISEDEFDTGILNEDTKQRLGLRSPKLTKALPHAVSSVYGLLTHDDPVSIVRFEDTNDERYILHQSDSKHFSSCMRSGVCPNSSQASQHKRHIKQDINNFKKGNLILVVSGDSWHENGEGYKARAKLRKVVASKRNNKVIGFFVEPIYGDSTTLHARMPDVLETLKRLYNNPDLQLYSYRYRTQQKSSKPYILGWIKARNGYRDTSLNELRSRYTPDHDELRLYNFRSDSILRHAYKSRYRNWLVYNTCSITPVSHKITQKEHSLIHKNYYNDEYSSGGYFAESYIRLHSDMYCVAMQTAIPWLRQHGYKCKHYKRGGWIVTTEDSKDNVYLSLNNNGYVLVTRNDYFSLHTHTFTTEERTNAERCNATASHRRNIEFVQNRESKTASPNTGW